MRSIPSSVPGPRLVVLGAGGKVGRLLHRFWSITPSENVRITYQHHQPNGPQGAVIWQYGDDPGVLDSSENLLVLWGVTPGSHRPLGQNRTLALQALELARKMGARRVFIASSAAVYAGAGPGPLAEDRPLAPVAPYGRAKLEMEQAVLRQAARADDIAVSCLRLANVVGADSLFAAMARGGEVTLDRFASGLGPRRSYLTAGDLARVVLALSALPGEQLPPVLNVAGSRALAMADLARAAGRKVSWRPAPPEALEQVELDTTRLARLVGPLAESSDPQQAIRAWQGLAGDRA